MLIVGNTVITAVLWFNGSGLGNTTFFIGVDGIPSINSIRVKSFDLVGNESTQTTNNMLL